MYFGILAHVLGRPFVVLLLMIEIVFMIITCSWVFLLPPCCRFAPTFLLTWYTDAGTWPLADDFFAALPATVRAVDHV